MILALSHAGIYIKRINLIKAKIVKNTHISN